MQEHNLERAGELFAAIRRIEGHLELAQKFGPTVSVTYQHEPFEASVNGVVGIYDRVDAFNILELNSDKIRFGVNQLIEHLLREKITDLRNQLRKLGVKMDDDSTPKKLPSVKKTLRLEAPNGGK